ncbi:MAG: PEP-CTERM system histidine kinase PrsK [Deltaproteobacteria bacterium]|nr:PEP-CTERM system histidine kinase PrsK [Deltaproteobacteria bacterium]
MINPSFFVIFPVLNILICLGLAFFILSRDYKSPANLGFASGLLSLLCLEFGNALVMLSAGAPQMMLTGLYLGIVGQLMLPPSWLLFSLTFSRENQKQLLLRWTPLLAGLTIISVVFIFFLRSPDFIFLSSAPPDSAKSPAPAFYLGSIGKYCYLYLILSILFSLVLLENTFRFSTGHKRWQIKYVIFGVGAILFFFIYYFSQLLLFSMINVELVRVLSIVILFSVSVMTVFIVRHRLLNVDVFVSRYIVYHSVTILIVGTYFILVGLVVYGIQYFNLPFDYSLSTLIIFLAIFILLVLGFSTSVRRKIQLFLNRHFYKHKYEFRDKWMESIEKISSKTSVDEICRTLIDMILETMGAKEVYLWLYSPVTGSYKAFNAGFLEAYENIESDYPLIKLIKQKKAPFNINHVFDEIDDGEGISDLEKLIAVTGGVLCSPLNAGGTIEGFVLQQEDVSGEPYRSDDFEFLTAVTTQAAVQLKNITLSQELIQVKEVDMFNKMSSFIMHDLKNLTNSLSLVSQNAAKNMDNPEFQKDAVKAIDNTVNRMKSLIEKLSSAPKKMDLKKERVDIKALIHNSMKKIMGKEKKVVCTAHLNDLPFIYADPHSIEMVLINLLTNAYDAINNNGIISVRSHCDDSYINVIVCDNGEGMTKEFIEKALFHPFKSSKKTGFGIGLYQSKMIIEAHGGDINVESEKGEGTSFTIRLPL